MHNEFVFVSEQRTLRFIRFKTDYHV